MTTSPAFTGECKLSPTRTLAHRVLACATTTYLSTHDHRYKLARCGHHTHWNSKMPWYGVVPTKLLCWRAPLFPLPSMKAIVEPCRGKKRKYSLQPVPTKSSKISHLYLVESIYEMQ